MATASRWRGPPRSTEPHSNIPHAGDNPHDRAHPVDRGGLLSFQESSELQSAFTCMGRIFPNRFRIDDTLAPAPTALSA